MVKKKSRTSLQREVAMLKKRKRTAIKSRKQLLARQKEIKEIRELEREVEFLKGVGSKKRIAREVSVRMGKQAGRLGWKGLKFAGKFVKSRLEAEAREQARDRARKKKPKVRAKVKKRKVTKSRARPKQRVRAKVKRRKKR